MRNATMSCAHTMLLAKRHISIGGELGNYQFCHSL
jgi:hypothetical protein